MEAENQGLRSRGVDRAANSDQVARLQDENQPLSATLDQFRQLPRMPGEDNAPDPVEVKPSVATVAPPRRPDFSAAAQGPVQPTARPSGVAATEEPQPRANRLSKAQQRAKNIFDAIQRWSEQHPGYGVALSPGFLKVQFQIQVYN